MTVSLTELCCLPFNLIVTPGSCWYYCHSNSSNIRLGQACLLLDGVSQGEEFHVEYLYFGSHCDLTCPENLLLLPGNNVPIYIYKYCHVLNDNVNKTLALLLLLLLLVVVIVVLHLLWFGKILNGTYLSVNEKYSKEIITHFCSVFYVK